MNLRSLLASLTLVAGCTSQQSGSITPVTDPIESRHLSNLRRLTNGGENAEAYFTADGKRLTFQSTREGRTCDQEYPMNIDGTGLHRVSNGHGKTTCGYFTDGGRR